MIDESLLKSNFLGRDGFVWWIGRVADSSVWKKENVVMSQSDSLGQRCKVRIIGYHPFTNELPEKDLPWAEVMMDAVTGGGQGGMGDSLCLVGGETCMGFFLDGEEAQQPVIIGLLNRHNSIPNSLPKEELLSSGTSSFKNFTGGNNERSTKGKSRNTNPIQTPKSPAIKGSIQLDVIPFVPDAVAIGAASAAAADADLTFDQIQADIVSKRLISTVEQGVIQSGGTGSNAAKNIEKRATKVQVNPSNCGNDAIGRITQILTDFIAFTNSLENSINKFVDPITNAIIDMDAEIKRIVRQVKGIVKGIINNIRNGIIGKLNLIFSQFLGKLNLVNPLDFISDEVSRKALQGILDTIFCIFEKVIEDLTGFLGNMFRTLIENIVNGPFCAAEQFVSGIFAKLFESLEDLLGPVLDGLDWLTGGIGVISDFIGKASNLASQILSFIGCDGRKCTTPSKWVSTLSGSISTAADDWEKQVSNINILKGVSSDLSRIRSEAESDIGNFFGSDQFQDTDYSGMKLGSILKVTDSLTGGNASGALDKGLGSIESAISTTSLFGTNTIFDACTEKINNPTRQRDLIPMPMGYKFEKGIPPEIQISGGGSGATAVPIVGGSNCIIAVQVTNPGSGYDSDTAASVIDNSNYGSGARLKVIVDDGKISDIVVLNCGNNYVSNDGPISSNPVGIITGIYIVSPGIGYTSGDSILIPLPRIIDDTVPGTPGESGEVNLPGYIVTPILTPGNGSIIDVNIPNIDSEYNFIPSITINTRTGRGADLIPILSYKQLGNTDTTPNRSGLVGITSVIDCI